MSSVILPYAIAGLLWISIIVYASLEGADFGAGLWDFFSFGPQAQKQRDLIRDAIGPVWEANNVWLTFLVVGLFTGFPIVAQLLSTALFIPLVLIVLGIVLRGSSFVFRSQLARAIVVQEVLGRVFSLASIIAPFLFGAAAATVASGRIRINGTQAPVGLFTLWLTPFAITIGFMGIALCATIAAVYLTVEAQAQKDETMMTFFRNRALISGGVLSVLGILGFILAPSEAPFLWHGILDHAIWAAAIAILLGLATGVALLQRRFRLARVLIVMGVAAIMGTWGLSQLPYLIPPDVTITGAASPPLTLAELLGVTIVGMGMLIPALWFLFFIFKGGNIIPPVHEKEIEGL
jgi:cytochrome d ubiquinol oxidase subunit II